MRNLSAVVEVTIQDYKKADVIRKTESVSNSEIEAVLS